MEFLDINKISDECDYNEVVKAFQNGELKDGDTVKFKCSIYTIRDKGGMVFIAMRGARGNTFQMVWEEGKTDVDIRAYKNEDCVIAEGKIIESEWSNVGFDILVTKLEKVGGAVVEQFPVDISKAKQMRNLQMPTLLNNRVLTLRNIRERAIIKVCEGVMTSFRDFLRSEGFTEFVPPKMVQAGAEGGAEMFEIDYFGNKAYLNQSPQMYKQIMVGVFRKVFTVSPVFRAENSQTNRHLTEFTGLDFEMGFIDSFEDIMAVEARLFQYMFKFINENYEQELDIVLGRGERLPELTQFPKIKFAEVKRLYAEAHNIPKIADPMDLSPDEETWIGQYFLEQCGSPIVFVTHYPSKKRPFYAMDDPENPDYTLSFDMLLYGLEVTTGGQRINDYNMQVEKMRAREMDIADFEDYLAMFKYGMPPHGGLGLGMERIVQKLLKLDNIKKATAFPRDTERLRP